MGSGGPTRITIPKRLAALLAFCALVCLSACQTMAGTRSLDRALADPSTLRVPLSRLDDGLFVLPVSLPGGYQAPFIIDTGATQSVLFAERAHALEADAGPKVRIHGMFGHRVVETLAMPNVALGNADLGRVSFAVLPSRRTSETGEDPWGIIGMDILERFRLYSPSGQDTLFLFPRENRSPKLPLHWTTVALTPNPYSQTGRSLRFMEMRVGGRVAPALLDTGASFNAMSYHFADFPQLRWMRETTKKRFKVEGALESYKPTLRVSAMDIRAGSRIWRDASFLVQDMDSLDVIGLRDRPFIIAGVGLLADETFFLDFEANVLRMPPSPSERNRERFAHHGHATASSARQVPRTAPRVDSRSGTALRAR